MTGTPPLEGSFRVIDVSTGIAGAYATKVLADAGAEVVLVEPSGGNPLRRRSVSGAPVDPDLGGVLFQFLSCSKASVQGDQRFLEDLVRGADAVVWDEGAPLSPQELRALAPHVTVLGITPYGLDNPWTGRPANEFILQSMAGTAWNHGPADSRPTMLGGNQGDYAVGAAGAMGLLTSRWRTMASGKGELLDLAGLEVLQLTHSMYPVTFLDLAHRPLRKRRADSIPSIHLSKDGRWVGLWVTTGQQWLDFCSLVERTDWYEDRTLGLMDNRAERFDELVSHIDQWVGERDCADIVEIASAFRIPVAEVTNGETLPEQEHFVERGFYVKNPRTGVTQPDVWYSMSGGAERRPAQPSPVLGADTERYRQAVAAASLTPLTPHPEVPGELPELPLEGLRIVDMTAFWAGPIVAHPLALLGADVIHVESAQRPDGIRMAMTVGMDEPGWWETSPYFNGTNTCKRDLTLDLSKPAGREALLKVIARSDALLENYSPRVMGQLGLSYEVLSEVRPELVMLRGPGFGTSGPWVDRVTYAPTIDEAAGLAWVTGEPHGRPALVGAASDAVGGMHGTIGLLLALEHRRKTGKGMLLESPQIGPALQVSAEQVLEFSAHGALLTRTGNRSWVHAPQGVYRCVDRVNAYEGVGSDDWLAVSVETDAQWGTLAALLELPDDWNVTTRRTRHDEIDERLDSWCASRSAEVAAEELTAAGVPAAAVIPPHELAELPPVIASALYEQVVHPVAGPMRIIGFPLRSTAGPKRWHRRPAPSLGQDNRDILTELAGLSDAEVDQLAADGITGTEVLANRGW